MDTFKLIGPYAVRGNASTIEDIPSGINGVYIWCVGIAERTYRVHYVGEAIDVKQRQLDHRAKQLNGKCHAFSPDDLVRNVKILMHRANEGMIPRLSNIARRDFNERYLEALNVFYAGLGPQASRNVRCAYESALIRAIEDHGQNVLHVGHVRAFPQRDGRELSIDTGSVHIEALSKTTLIVYGS